MSKKIWLTGAAFALMATLPTAAKPPALPAVVTAPQVHSRYAILIDAATGKVLWARNAKTKRSIASTTKIMTAILLLERGRLSDTVTATNDVKGIEDSSLHLSPGEKISVHDLLYAMLLRSANDTAVAGADYIAGSLPAFADLMNAKAKEIGAQNTHFVTPNGLYAPGHYSTAHDMAKIAAYAVNTLPTFNEIVHTQKFKVQRSVHTRDVWVKNTATKFLKDFPGADGIKTGYIHQAGHCFVSSATRKVNGRPWRLIAVALDSPICREDDISLLNYGFSQFTPKTVVKKGDPLGTVNVPGYGPVSVASASDIVVPVARFHASPPIQWQVTPVSITPSQPLWHGTQAGTLTVRRNGSVIAMGKALSERTVGPDFMARLSTAPKIAKTNWTGWIVGGVALLAGGILYGNASAKGARRRRSRVASGVRRVD